MPIEPTGLRLSNTAPGWNNFWNKVGASMFEQDQSGEAGKGFLRAPPGIMNKITQAVAGGVNAGPSVSSSPGITPATPAVNEANPFEGMNQGPAIGDQGFAAGIGAKGIGLDMKPVDYQGLGEAVLPKGGIGGGSLPWLTGNGGTGMTAPDAGANPAAPGLSGSPYGEAFAKGMDAMNAAVAEFKDAKDFDSQFAAKVKINALGAQLKDIAGMNQTLGAAGIAANTASAKLAQEGQQFGMSHQLAQSGLNLKGMYEMGLLGNANRALDIKEGTEGDKSLSKLLQLAAVYGTTSDALGNKTVDIGKASDAYKRMQGVLGVEGPGLEAPKRDAGMSRADYLIKAKAANPKADIKAIMADADQRYTWSGGK